MGLTGELPPEYRHTETIRVLYVDSQPDAANRCTEALEREDDRFDARFEIDTDAAIERFETTEIDCLVSASELAGTSGLQFLEAVRTRDETVPFVLFPKDGSEALASEAISRGVTEYVRNDGNDDSYARLATRVDAAIETTAVRRSRERRLAAIETAQEGIALLDIDERFVYVNRSHADCFGYEPSTLLGEHWEILYDETEAATIREDALPTVRADGEWNGETTAVRADGSRVVVDHTLSTTQRDELICTVRDISGRKERERDLERYETIVEALGDPIYTVDADGRYAFVNDAYAELTGHDKSEIVGQPISFLLDEPSAERGVDAVRTLLSGENDASQRTYEIAVKTSGSDRIECEDNVSLLPLEDGRYRGVAGVVRDITDRKERERELKRQNERLESFANVVSHDLRNPLTVAQGQLELARQHRDDEHLETVARAHERMQRLIEDILALAREDRSIAELEPLDLETFARICWRTVETNAATLRTPTEAVVRADRSRFKQLLENLFRNAVEHGSPDRSEPESANRDAAGGDDTAVTLTIGDLSERAGFYVADDGRGIPPSEHEQVFENGYTTAADGTGFGLAIVEGIADAHGWTVTLTEGDAGGARFEFRDVDALR